MLAPFLVVYLLVYSFFRYFEEYHRNPASLGSRQYTLLARWRFREYNELPHLFQQRLHQSYASARTYLDQFPRARIVRVARFGAFISGSFVAVFLLGAVIEPDVMVHFDIVPGRNVLFFLGVCGTALAAFRGMIPDEHAVRDPQAALDAVIHYTHYCPPAWRQGQMYSTRVLREFCGLYALKVHVFVNELLSVLITPLVLWRCQERLAEKYVDFFRHGTVHVSGLGYVCRYAAFDVDARDNSRSLYSHRNGAEHAFFLGRAPRVGVAAPRAAGASRSLPLYAQQLGPRDVDAVQQAMRLDYTRDISFVRPTSEGVDRGGVLGSSRYAEMAESCRSTPVSASSNSPVNEVPAVLFGDSSRSSSICSVAFGGDAARPVEGPSSALGPSPWRTEAELAKLSAGGARPDKVLVKGSDSYVLSWRVVLGSARVVLGSARVVAGGAGSTLPSDLGTGMLSLCELRTAEVRSFCQARSRACCFCSMAARWCWFSDETKSKKAGLISIKSFSALYTRVWIVWFQCALELSKRLSKTIGRIT